MILTIQHVFEAAPIVAAIMNENRPISSKGKYRIARMNRKLDVEWKMIAERYNGMISAYNHKRPVREIDGPNGQKILDRIPDAEFAALSDEAKAATRMQSAVPDDKWQEFQAAWKEVGAEEIEVAVEPIPIDQLSIDGEVGSISAAEFGVLDTLVEG